MSDAIVAGLLVCAGLVFLGVCLLLLSKWRVSAGASESLVSTNSALLRALRDAQDAALSHSEQHLQAMKIRNWADWNAAASERDLALRHERELAGAEPFRSHPDASSFSPSVSSALSDDEFGRMI
jgi:hypothetical protein